MQLPNRVDTCTKEHTDENLQGQISTVHKQLLYIRYSN